MIIFVWRNISLKYIKKHAQLKAYKTKAWPHYRQMKAFMPGTQPCGTHVFDPYNSFSQSAIQILNVVDAEEDGEEDQVGPPFDSPMSNVPAAAFVPPDFEITSVQEILSRIFTSSTRSQSRCRCLFFQWHKTPIVFLLFPTVNPHPTQQHDISMDSATTVSDAGTRSSRKRKHSARSASGAQPRSSKRASKSKTDDLNPVIISNALNSTLNCIVDVMERTLDATAVTTTNPTTAPITSAPPHSLNTSPVEFQTAQLSSTPSQTHGPPSNPTSTSTSPAQLLDQAIQLVSADDSSLSEDEIFSASIFFNSATEEAVRAARTVITLSNNRTVQHRFLLRQLDMAALLPGRGKAKAVEDDMDY